MSAESILEVLDTDGLYHRDDALQRQRVIDNFEYGNSTLQSRYRTVPSTGSWSTNTTSKRPKSNGTRGLDLNGQRTIYSVPGDGLKNYPEPGTTFVYYLRPRSWTPESQIWLFFGGTSKADGYRYQIDLILNDGTFRVQRDTGSGKIVLDSDRMSFNSSYWYAIYVDWKSGGGFDIWITRDGYKTVLANLSSSDKTYTSRSKIGYRTNINLRTFVDDIQFVL